MAASHSVVLYEPTETSKEVTTAAGFLAGYSGRTREAYTLDLRQLVRCCGEHCLPPPFDVTRTHFELYARELEELGRSPATIGQRLTRDAARTVRRLAKRAGINKRIGPHSLRHSFITAALDAGVPL